ncbi:iron compound ABC uptake transporter [Vibrio ishigakensis]|uniref:Iron compound ABC uptake transporter n=1 Tax=Vibrio ishigakensis TaxID=1481914 RepID=A0A0B8PHB6_9VIBR|nr:iron compound ABC uptake transporter [Vibrio ishigakensis]
MVVAQDTDYVFLDEPLNNLDIKHSVAIMKSLQRLAHESGKAVVIVIHDINFASVYSDAIIAMKQGEVVANGPTEQVIEAKTLSDIYEIDFQIAEANGQRICLYYS